MELAIKVSCNDDGNATADRRHRKTNFINLRCGNFVLYGVANYLANPAFLQEVSRVFMYY